MVFPADQDPAADLLSFVAPVAIDAESLTSGTGVQISTVSAAILSLDITGASSGTVKIELSPDGTTYHTVVPATAANAVASHGRTVLVPAGYYVKVTLSVATISSGGAVAVVF